MTISRVVGFLAGAAGFIIVLWIIALAIVSDPQPESPAANLDKALDSYGGPDVAQAAYHRE